MSRQIAIIGGGIIGTCTAYYLSRHPKLGESTIRVFEGTAIASGASGKGGGFLAKDWHGSSTASLAELSYRLHEELAMEHDGATKWGYRPVTTLSVQVYAGRRKKHVPDAEWLSSVSGSRVIGTEQTTAQVTPGDFTREIARAAQSSGVEIVLATITGLREIGDDMKELIAETNEGERMLFQATDVVFAAGPWTGQLARTLLGNQAGAAGDIVPSNCSNSIIIRPGESSHKVTPHSLFTSVRLPDGTSGEPEIYPRMDGTVYICGGGSSTTSPLPPRASEVLPTEEMVTKLRNYAAFVSPSHLNIAGATLETTQACYRPDSSKTHAPIIGKLHDRLWVASGHQVWGICNGPGTGKVMAELILEGEATSADISSLSP